jgi:hypothetical protein
MDPAYEAYFADRLDRMSGERTSSGFDVMRQGLAFEDPAHFVARGAVERARAVAQAEHGMRLRGDAALLLYLLSYEFVSAPVRRVRPEQADQLTEAVSADTERIVRTAAERVQDRADGISAHGVINALSVSWDGLQTTAFNVWS